MEYRRRLLFHGIALFLIGLFTGLAEQHFVNVRMALAAHLEGVMNGIFLLAVGAIWNEVKLSSRSGMAAYWALLSGTYGNWAVTTTAAILGTAALSPIAAAGQRAAPWQETLVTAGFVLIGLAVIFSVSIAFVGAARQGEARRGIAAIRASYFYNASRHDAGGTITPPPRSPRSSAVSPRPSSTPAPGISPCSFAAP
jgi:(hydroxyamino)benzene mutase